MANHDSDLESNVNKRVKMNITMNIELKNSESGKDYHKIVEAVKKNAMACIDAALAPTNSINNGTPTPADNEEMAKLRRSLDNKSSKTSKNIKGNATSSNTTSTVSSETKKANTSGKEGITNIETDKRVENEAMKNVRQSLELKKLKNLKKNKNDNSGATSSRCGVVAGTNKANYSKEATNTIPKGGKEKPPIETEAMKRVRLRLELKNKTKENNATPSTSSSTNSSCQRIEGTGNTKRPGTGIKRKFADVGTDKTQTETERVKRKKVRNSGRNENYSRTANTTSGITYEQIHISDECDDTDDENISASSVTGTDSTNTARDTKRITEKAGVETEAMKLIRRRLELNKNKNKNEVASSSTITSTTRVVKENEKVKSPKTNPTEDMKIMKERIERRKKPQTNETRNTKTTYAKSAHAIDVTCNPSPGYSYTFEITEDESDDNSPVYTNKNSETTNTDNNKASRSTPASKSSHLSAMSADVGQPDKTAPTTIGRTTRSKSSKTWERKVWTK